MLNLYTSRDIGFNTLVNKFDFPPVAALTELYASGELAEVLKLASQVGIGRAFQENASPTCQFGIAASIERNSKSKAEAVAEGVMKRIQDGSFRNDLEQEGKADYPAVKQLWKMINSKTLVETQSWINQAFKNGD